MSRFFYQDWWKYLAIIILLYVFIAGFWVPLKPGIFDVGMRTCQSGEDISLEVYTYNTQWDNGQGEDISAYLKLDSVHLLEAKQVNVQDRKSIVADFQLPNYLPDDKSLIRATVIVLDPDGRYLLTPQALAIKQNPKIDSTRHDLAWDSRIGAVNQAWEMAFPFRSILYETIRNTFFHVAIWFAMFILLIIALVYSIRYIRSSDLIDDAMAASFTHVAIVFGLIGMATGSVWAKATWGTYWTNDPKLNMSAAALMIYVAYAILRASIPTDDRRAKVSAAYNIFAFAAMIPLIFIIPRLTSSLHPGNGGNPALGGEDLDSTLRMIFYPAIIGLTLLGGWISGVLYRIRRISIWEVERDL